MYKQVTLAINGRGARLRGQLLGDEVKSSRQFVVRSGDLLVSKIDARKGAAAVVPEGLDGAIVTADFPTFEIDQRRAIPAFVDLVVRRREFAALADAISAGTTNRVRMDLSRFPDLAIELPPLVTQRRIGDLIAALDAAVESAGHQMTAASAALSAYLAHAVRNAPGRSVPVSDLAVLATGASWSAADVVSDPIDNAIPVVGIRNTPPGQRWVQVSSPVFVRGLSNSDRRLDETSLLMIRTNGNRARIGNVYRVPRNAVGSAYSAFQVGLFPKDQRDSEYLYWLLVSPAVQDEISLASSGTTGLGNIAVSWLRNLPLPWSAPEYRQRVSELANALDEVRSGAVEVRDRLSRLRTALLGDLLSGDHHIPNSYDRFLDGAA